MSPREIRFLFQIGAGMNFLAHRMLLQALVCFGAAVLLSYFDKESQTVPSKRYHLHTKDPAGGFLPPIEYVDVDLKAKSGLILYEIVALRQLDVGGTMEDHDGDTWERIE